MENAADALKMAAFVLIFVVMLTITISSFSEARRVSQTVLEYQDKKFDYTGNNNYKFVDASGKLTTERIVGAESIIPAVYRSFLENYKVYFLDKTGNGIELYKKHINGADISINYIDLEADEIISLTQEKKEQFILAILYGRNHYNKKFDEISTYFLQNSRINLKKEGLYDTILKEGIKFKESLGEYYQEDEQIINNGQMEDSGNATTETNKEKKRIITYKQCN